MGLFDTFRSGAWLRPCPPLTETNAGREHGAPNGRIAYSGPARHGGRPHLG